MKYEVEESIYKISQDRESHDLIFYVYGREERRGMTDHNLNHDELHEVLLEMIHWYQNKTRGEK